MCEDLASILGAAGLVVLGWVLATISQVVMARRAREARQRAALIGFREEMASNYRSAENNLNLLGFEERGIHGGGEPLTNPLNLLESGAWQQARLDLPDALLEDFDLMDRLRIVHTNTSHINDLISSREGFRIEHLESRPLLLSGLDSYKGILMHLLRDLKERIEEAIRELEPYIPK